MQELPHEIVEAEAVQEETAEQVENQIIKAPGADVPFPDRPRVKRLQLPDGRLLDWFRANMEENNWNKIIWAIQKVSSDESILEKLISECNADGKTAGEFLAGVMKIVSRAQITQAWRAKLAISGTKNLKNIIYHEARLAKGKVIQSDYDTLIERAVTKIGKYENTEDFVIQQLVRVAASPRTEPRARVAAIQYLQELRGNKQHKEKPEEKSGGKQIVLEMVDYGEEGQGPTRRVKVGIRDE